MKFYSCLLSIHSIPRQSERLQPARLKVTRRSEKKQPGNLGASHWLRTGGEVQQFGRTGGAWHIAASPPSTASPCVPRTRHPGAPRAHEDAQAVPAAREVSDPANCPQELLPQARQAGLALHPRTGNRPRHRGGLEPAQPGTSAGRFPLTGCWVPGQAQCHCRGSECLLGGLWGAPPGPYWGCIAPRVFYSRNPSPSPNRDIPAPAQGASSAQRQPEGQSPCLPLRPAAEPHWEEAQNFPGDN